MSGKIHLILGCMFSGKSTELIRRYKRHTIGGKKCIMIKYKGDIRYDEKQVVTHDNIKLNAICCENLYEAVNIINLNDFDVICIDEIQFYKDGPQFCDEWANRGKIIEACGLNGTFQRKPFNVISELIPLVEDIVYLTAVCKENGSDAHFSKRSIDNNNEQVIGGSDIYDAVDRKTYFKNRVKKIDKKI